MKKNYEHRIEQLERRTGINDELIVFNIVSPNGDGTWKYHETINGPRLSEQEIAELESERARETNQNT
jgi:hypothetical protein